MPKPLERDLWPLASIFPFFYLLYLPIPLPRGFVCPFAFVLFASSGLVYGGDSLSDVTDETTS